TTYTFAEDIEPETVAVEATGFAANVADFVTLSGDVGFKKSGTNLIAVGSDVTASMTAGTASVSLADADFGLQTGGGQTAFELKNGEFSAVLGDSLSASATAVVVRYTGAVTVAAGTTLAVGSTNYTFAEEIAPNTTAFDIGGATLTTPITDLSGDFAVETSGTSPNEEMLFGASQVTAFVGDKKGTTDTADDLGVRLSDISLVVLIKADKTYAFDGSGTASLVGVPDLMLSGSLSVQKNTTGEPVNRSLTVGGVSKTLNLTAGVSRVGGSVTLATQLADLSGDFAVETSGTSPNKEVLFGASHVTTFVGDEKGAGDADDLGVRLSDISLVVLIKADKTYAFDGSGTASLVGVPDLTLSGSLSVQKNTTGAAVDRSLTVGGVTKTLDLVKDVSRIGGSVHLAVAGFVDVSGDFSVQKAADGSQLLIGVTGVTAFLGAGYGTSDAIGLQVTQGKLGLVVENGAYALVTSGDVGLVGLDGLDISGSFGVRANQLHATVNETISTPDGSVTVAFDTGEDVLSFSGSATLSVAGVFTLQGEVEATKTGSGMILVDVPNMSLNITIGGQNVFGLGGKARFGIGGGDGFQLLDIGLTEISVLGIDVSALAGALPSFAMPSDAPAPAKLATIVDGIDAALLNRRKYLDITFDSPTDQPLDPATILDVGAEFTLSGPGLGDAAIQSVEHRDGNTFRYYLRDADPNNETDLFQPGAIAVHFQASSWADTDGEGNDAATADFTARDGEVETSDAVELGPLSLQGPYFGLEDFQFKPLKNAAGGLDGAQLVITVGLGVDHAGLSFGSSAQESSSGVSASVDGLLGTFDVLVNLDVPGCLSQIASHPLACIAGGGLGKFHIEADTLNLTIADVLTAEAHGLVIQYDPVKDQDNDGMVSAEEQAAYDSQELVRLQDATVTIIPISLEGSVGPYTRDDSTTIPGLVVRRNGFHLGEAKLTYTGSLNFGSLLSLTGVAAGVTDFGVSFGGAVDFDGEVFIAADRAALFPGKTVSLTLSDGPDADKEAVRAALTFTDGVPDGFKFNADQVDFKFGSFLTITGESILIDTTATDENPVARFGSIGATVAAGPLKVSGQMRSFGFLSDGSFRTYDGFGVFLSVDGATGDSFQWPSWLPIRITELGVQWDDLNDHPERFSLIVSAAISGLDIVPDVKFSGAIKGIRIDVGLLLDGKFPITDIQSIGVSVEGDMFGGKVKGALIGGILRLDADGNQIGALDQSTPVTDRVFFVGVEGGIEIAKKGGFTIRFAISELGPLGVQVVGELPEGILLEPISGLKLRGFSGGVEFFSSLPDAFYPEDLLDPEFAPALSTMGDLNAEEWLDSVTQQVIDQHRALQNSPVAGGFFAAFLNPMVISGGAEFTLHPPSDVLKANVEVRLSTDGKLLVTGDLILFDGLQRIPARIYGDLSKIATGQTKLLLMAQDIPTGPSMILQGLPTSAELRGTISMKYLGPGGEVVDFFDPNPAAATPTTALADPVENGQISLAKLSGRGYLEVQFTPAPDAELDTASILDAASELELQLPNGTTIALPGVPTRDESSPTGVYRYALPAGLTLVPGDYTVRVLEGTWSDSLAAANPAHTATFEVVGAAAELAAPVADARIDRATLNGAGRLAVRFLPTAGSRPDASTVTDAAPEFTLYGAAAEGVVLGTPLADENDANLYYYPFTGEFGSGLVEVRFVDDGFRDTKGNGSLAATQTFVSAGPEGDLLSPLSGAAIDVVTLNQQRYIEVRFTPSGGVALDPASLTDADPEFELTGAAAGAVTLDGTAVPVEGQDDVYRYAFSGAFQPGQVVVEFIDGAWQDVDGVVSTAESEGFTVLGVQAALVGIQSFATTGLSLLNQRGYLDVQFTPTTGATLDLASIMDAGAEVSLTGLAAAGVTLSGVPTSVGDGVYRYAFTGAFAAGEVGVEFPADGVLDSADYGTTARTTAFAAESPAAGLLSPQPDQRMDRSKFNGDHYFDIQFQDRTGRGLDVASITDSGQEFTLLVKDDAGNWVAPRAAVDGAAVQMDATTFRYYFSDFFNPGVVRVLFTAGSFRDLDGAVNEASEESFAVVANAPSFEFQIVGSYVQRHGFKTSLFGDLTNPAQVHDLMKMFGVQDGDMQTLLDIMQGVNQAAEIVQTLITSPIYTLDGFVRLGSELLTDDLGEIVGARTTLDASGTVGLYLVGNVGAAAGRIVIQADQSGLNIWSVMELQAKLDFLNYAGIDLDGFAHMQFNTSTETQTEALTLRGFGKDGGDLVQTFIIDPLSFGVQAAGKLLFHVPTFNPDAPFGPELFRLSAAASLDISPAGLSMFVNGAAELGPAELQVLDLDATGVIAINDQGFAADLNITAFAGVSDVLTLTGQFRLATNTSGVQQEVLVAQRFIDEGYLAQDFVDSLSPCADDPGQLCYAVPAGPPKLDGTYGPAGPYVVIQGQGAMQLVDIFALEGSFRVEASTQGLFMQADAGLRLAQFGQANTLGYLEITPAGLVAAMSVDVDLPALRAVGVDFGVDAQLVINTTGETKTIRFLSDAIGAEPIIAPPEMAQIQAAGIMAVRVPATDRELVRISGVFVLQADAQGLAVFADGVIPLPDPAQSMLTLEATGALVINSQGVAAEIDLAVVPTGQSVFAEVFSFDVTARAVFNSTAADQEVEVPEKFQDFLSAQALARLEPASDGTGLAYVVPGGAPKLDGTEAAPGVFVVFILDGQLTLASVFNLSGSYRLAISEGLFEVEANAQLALAPIGQVDASGTLRVTNAGVVGALQLGGRFELGPLQIYGAMQLELNTTGSDQTIQRYQYDFPSHTVSTTPVDVTLAPDTLRIFVGGVMSVSGFNLQGTFELLNNPNVISVSFDASFNAFDVLRLHAGGAVSIVKGANPGLVMNMGASLESGFLGIDGVFDMNTSFQLLVNTRGGGGSDAYDLGVQRGLTRIAVSGELTLLGALSMQGGGYIESVGGVFRLQIGMSTSFFGLASLNASGFFSSEGEFDVYFGGGFTFGAPGFLGVSAGGSIHVWSVDDNGTAPFGDGNTQLNVAGGLNGTFWVFGFSVGAGIGVNYSSATGLLSVTPRLTLDFFFFQIHLSATFNIGVLKANPPIYVGGNADDTYGQKFRGGVLYLNMGSRAGLRCFDSDVTNEHFEITTVGPDLDNGGTIVRVASGAVKQTFRGVTSIVADGGSGRDFLETDADLPIPVTFIGGDDDDRIIHRGTGPATIFGGNGQDLIETHATSGPVLLSGGGDSDTIRHYGSAPATIDGGYGDDTITGGTGNDTYVFTEGYGYDVITDTAGTSTLNFDGVLSDLTALLQTGSAVVTSAATTRTNHAAGFVRVDSTDPNAPGPTYVAVTMVHDGGHRLVIQHSDHPFQEGDEIEIASPDFQLGEALRTKTKWKISEVTADGYVLDLPVNETGRGAAGTAYYFDLLGNQQHTDVVILHDGDHTATVYQPGHTMQVGDHFYLKSPEASNYNGEFEVTAVSDEYYAFHVAFALVSDSANTDFGIAGLTLGRGDDRVNVDASQTVAAPIDDPHSGSDQVFVSGALPSAINLQDGRVHLNNVDLTLVSGIDRLTLYDPTQSLTLNSASGAVDLGETGLRVVADSVALNTAIDASHIVLETQGTLSVAHPLNATHDGYIDLRVFGDNASVLVNQPLSVSTGDTDDGLGAGWIRLEAPDGSITGSTFTAPNSHLIWKAKNAPAGTLNTDVGTLTLAYAPSGTPGDITIVEQDDLTLTSLDHHDTPFGSGSAFGDGTFSGVTWVATAAADWLDQVRDGNDQYALVVPHGNLSITLLAEDSLLYLDAGKIATLEAGKDITIIADDVSFRSGAAQVSGTGKLTIQAHQAVWNYRVGTAGENQMGSDLARDAFVHDMDLTSGDLAALADGFAHITIGRSDTGNTMLIGDAFHAYEIKYTGQARERDARFRDPTELLTDSLIVAGDVQATGTLDIQAPGGLTVQGPNLQVPLGGIDSGLTALELFIDIGNHLLVSGWMVAKAVLGLVVDGDVTVDVGAWIETQEDDNTFAIDATGSISIAGTVQAGGHAGRPQLNAGGTFSLQQGGVISAPGADALVRIQSAELVTLESGTAVLAGVTFDSSSGSPLATVTGAHSNVVLQSPHELFIPGAIAASDGISLEGGAPAPDSDHSDYFHQAVPATHPLYNRTQYAMLITGTLTTFGDGTDLVLSAADDVIVRGNLDVRGAGSNLTIQSDSSVFFEGQAQVADGNLKLYGRVALNGTVLGGADDTESSVTVYGTSEIQVPAAGRSIDIRGAQDVDLSGAIIAGGVLGSGGVTWTAPGDATISVTAGQQVYVDTALQASRSVSVNGGTPGADDNNLSVVVTPVAGLNAAGLSATDGVVALVAITAVADLELMGQITSGATLVETASGATYEWAGHRDGDVQITAGGQAYMGGNTVNIDGDPITTGGFIHAGRNLQISGGSHTSGVGVSIHPNSELSTHNADGSIVISSDQDAVIRGRIASGGEINDGVSTLYGGDSTVDIEAAYQVLISREVAAGKAITVVGGDDPVVAGDATSGHSVVVAGTGLLRTAAENSLVDVSGPNPIDFFAPLDPLQYNVQAAGLGSVIKVTSGGQLTLGGRLQSYHDIVLNGLDPTGGDATEGSTVELTETSLLETINGSIALNVGASGLVRGSLTAGGAGSDIIILSTADDLTLGGALAAADEIVLQVPGVLDVQGNLTAGNVIRLTAGTDTVAGQTDLRIYDTARLTTTGADAVIALTARNNVLIEGVVGAAHVHQDAGEPAGLPHPAVMPTAVSITSLAGDVTIAKAGGRVESGAGLSLAGQAVNVLGVVRTTGAAAAAGDYDVTFASGTMLTVTGDVAVAGSLLATAPQSVAVAGGTLGSGTRQSSGSLATSATLRIESPEITIGAAEMVGGKLTERGGVVASAGQVQIAADDVTIRSGAQVLATGDGSAVQIDADYLDVIGGVRAGQSLDADGHLTWTGQAADVTLNIRELLTLGGQGYNGLGQLTDVGGRILASGAIAIDLTGGAEAVGFTVANDLGLVQSDATGGGAFTPAAPSSISLTTDRDLRVAGSIVAADAGSSVTLTAGKLLRIDGFVQAGGTLTATGGTDVSNLSIQVSATGTLTTGDGGSITLAGPDEILLEGAVGQPHFENEIAVVDTGSIRVTTPAAVNVNGSLYAQQLIALAGSQVNVLHGGWVHVTHAAGLIHARTAGNLLVANGAELLSSGSIHLFAQNIRVDGWVENDNAGGASRVLANAVESVVITGTIISQGNLELNAGVGTDWTDDQLTGSITAADLTGGLVRVEGAGKVEAGAALKAASGEDMQLQADPTSQAGQRPVLTPTISWQPETIDVVVGYRQVAGGTVLTPVVKWVETKAEVQTGVELVKNGDYYHTLDVTLTQDGYYNGTTQREYFTQGLDYANSLAEVTYPVYGATVVDSDSVNLISDGQFRQAYL
ncbi:MAG: hypothetical protein NTY19_19505, partial [Planctomycetota bacterium]|nr:hypothetical protein [Planctomycetota bacterium]